MASLLCPVCKNTLLKNEKSLSCDEGHNFDLARQGYVNLMRGGGTKKGHGDDRLMVCARAAFLEGGHYDCLANRVAELASEHVQDGDCVLDVGCGEGYYSCRVKQELERAGKRVDLCGVDISREALIAFSHRTKDATLAVASISSLPFESGSVNLLLNLFAPQSDEEFLRVLAPGGKLLCVFPLEEHLFGLKRAVYDVPYANPAPDYAPAGFRLIHREDVRKTLVLDNTDDIQNLFTMTPYYYKTSRADQEKLRLLSHLETPLAFGIFLYEKI
ncbi:MAG: methyltransferase domain-containing protein [Clostridia bacterium]|nr:methyltransferase domain-containing protein [Clostridia bacterium]